MLKGSCHCDEAQWTFNTHSESARACKSPVCRRYGALWIYGYEGLAITISGKTTAYARDSKHLSFHFCRNCGNVAYWHANQDD